MRKLLVAVILLGFAINANAQLQPFSDYDISDSVWSVTTVRVDPNMGDFYLEGLRDTWVKSFEIAKELGTIVDYKIFRSQLPQSGDFNLLLVVEYANSAAMEPSEERYNAFMEKWGEENQARSNELVKDYPSMRTITGQYNLRQITIK
jgi:hypothetical protein